MRGTTDRRVKLLLPYTTDMAASTSKVSAKITALDGSLDELEAKLDPLFAQTLPESIVELDKIQQARLQVAIPYVLHDLVFSTFSITCRA